MSSLVNYRSIINNGSPAPFIPSTPYNLVYVGYPTATTITFNCSGSYIGPASQVPLSSYTVYYNTINSSTNWTPASLANNNLTFSKDANNNITGTISGLKAGTAYYIFISSANAGTNYISGTAKSTSIQTAYSPLLVSTGSGSNNIAYSTNGLTWTGLGINLFNNIAYTISPVSSTAYTVQNLNNAYEVFTFTTPGTYTLTLPNITQIGYLVVGGGGAGGGQSNNYALGGGGGGVSYCPAANGPVIPANTIITIIVGSGGATADAVGGTSSVSIPGSSRGVVNIICSGGGGSGTVTTGGSVTGGAFGTSGTINNGGTSGVNPVGGLAVNLPDVGITGTYFGGGGGFAAASGSVGGGSGSGGGGIGLYGNPGTSGKVNTGGGGSGNGYNISNGVGLGGSGIVYIYYKFNTNLTAVNWSPTNKLFTLGGNVNSNLNSLGLGYSYNGINWTGLTGSYFSNYNPFYTYGTANTFPTPKLFTSYTDLSFTIPGTYYVTFSTDTQIGYLVVGGGSSGNTTGGGGGGGGISFANYASGYTISAGTTLTITVGSGGVCSNNTANPGGSSSIIGTGINVLCNGGIVGAGGAATGGLFNFSGGRPGDSQNQGQNATPVTINDINITSAYYSAGGGGSGIIISPLQGFAGYGGNNGGGSGYYGPPQYIPGSYNYFNSANSTTIGSGGGGASTMYGEQPVLQGGYGLKGVVHLWYISTASPVLTVTNITWSPTQSLCVATGGKSNTLVYSTDGMSWTGLGNNIFSTEAFGVGYGNNTWVACGTGTNTLARSVDGISWTGIPNTLFTTCYSVAWSSSQNMWIAAGQNITSNSFTNLVSNGYFTPVPYAGGYGSPAVWQQTLVTNGAGISAVPLPWAGTNGAPVAPNNPPGALSVSNGNPSIMSQNITLTAGVTYLLTFHVFTVNNGTGSTLYLQLGNSYYYVYNNSAPRQSLLNNWVYYQFGYTATSTGSTALQIYSNCLQSIYLTNVSVTPYLGSLASSTDGITWNSISNPAFSNNINSVYWSGTLWVAVGSGVNSIAYSKTGFNWTGLGTDIFTTQGTCLWYWVQNQPPIWVATGSGNNSLAYSTDGFTWTGLGANIFTTGNNVTGAYSLFNAY